MARRFAHLGMVCAWLAGTAAAHGAWFDAALRDAKDIWASGQHEVFFPLHTHHLRFAYSDEKIDTYQENTWGLGYGRGKYIDDGAVWHGLYAMGFQDSHYKPSYMAGYARKWLWRPGGDWQVGGGFTAFLMTRSDVWGYFPFPGILPIASVGYKNLSIETAYVPGGQGNGNVLFFWGKFAFDR